ncbi:uncharacterized protein LOC143350181 [Colletes latitarsis]|uniref:uncharacterized protein LOC143350181 n=1 Tax=Colletes latitarsis TaxID=2605962 RepID=UPI004036FAAA
MLPCTKNPNYIPYHYTKTKPFSFIFYNPYTNTIPKMKTMNSPQSKNLNTRRFSYFCPPMSQYFGNKESKFNYSLPDNISQDSAISMDDNLYNYPNLTDEFHNMSELSVAQTDSGIDMSTSKYLHNTIQTNELTLPQQSNFPVTSTMLDMHSVFSSSVVHNNKKSENKISDVLSSENICTRSELHNLKSSTLCKKRITQHINKHCPDSEDHALKFCKNIQCTQNSFFLQRKIVTPKRYIKWRKVKSCIMIHRINSSDKLKLKRMHSHPNLLNQYDSEFNDSLLDSSPTPTKCNRSFLSTCKLNSSILSKFNRLKLSPMFKQYVLVSSCSQIPDNHKKQKYTPLYCPFPTLEKVAKLSNSEHGSRNNLTSHGKYTKVSSKICTLKDDHIKQEKQEDKPVSSVSFFF